MIEPYKTKALERLKRANGQIQGIIRMIEEDKYCADVLTQLLALQGALKGVMPLVLENHLTTCGPKQLGSNDSAKRKKFIKEIVKACELSSR
ncbi:MAG: metal-sensitive transcriptional regulator [Candidatus Peregrinibacteria bacterium]